MNTHYLPRIADAQLTAMLSAMGAVVIDGPKASGKTSTAERQAGTVFRLESDRDARELAETFPAALLSQEVPVVIDEWQVVPELWNLVRHEVDARRLPGQFILTGSATPNDDPKTRRHSGAGRFGRLRMRPLSLFESAKSTGAVSLARLFDGEFSPELGTGGGIQQIAQDIVVGGWPHLVGLSTEAVPIWHQGYLETIVEVDIPALGSRRDPQAITRLMSAMARSTGLSVPLSTLGKIAGGEDPLAAATTKAYVSALDRLMLLEELPAWTPSMRSSTPLRKTPKRYFVDPSIAAYLMGGSTKRLLSEMSVFGQLFESLVVRDTLVYGQPLGAKLYHWRDNNDHEVDIIAQLPDGRWGAIEVKLNPNQVSSAADSLLRFKAKVNTDLAGDPQFLAVINATGAAFQRKDGVVVIPITSLGP